MEKRIEVREITACVECKHEVTLIDDEWVCPISRKIVDDVERIPPWCELPKPS